MVINREREQSPSFRGDFGLRRNLKQAQTLQHVSASAGNPYESPYEQPFAAYEMLPADAPQTHSFGRLS